MMMMMKLSVITHVLLLLQSAQGWVFSVLGKETAQKTAAATGAVSIALVSAAPVAAGAADVFTGSYADPKHVNCLREIVVAQDTNVASLSGTDGNPGCPPDGSGKPWTLSGKVDGLTILVDFSPKGGPANLKGFYDTSAPEGIQWPDGNKWAKIGQ